MAQKFISIRLKQYFFDRDAVMARIEKSRLAMLSRAGAFVRRAARSSLRRRKRISSPGSPPSVHSKDDYASLKNILFAYDPARDSVIVGPLGLRSRNNVTIVSVSGAVPGTLEHGGPIGVREIETSPGKWLELWGRARRWHSGKPQRTRIVNVQARPFMRPALEANVDKFPGFFNFTLTTEPIDGSGSSQATAEAA
jgi:hypothetical protein